jgi:hypothetical protein
MKNSFSLQAKICALSGTLVALAVACVDPQSAETTEFVAEVGSADLQAQGGTSGMMGTSGTSGTSGSTRTTASVTSAYQTLVNFVKFACPNANTSTACTIVQPTCTSDASSARTTASALKVLLQTAIAGAGPDAETLSIVVPTCAREPASRVASALASARPPIVYGEANVCGTAVETMSFQMVGCDGLAALTQMLAGFSGNPYLQLTTSAASNRSLLPSVWVTIDPIAIRYTAGGTGTATSGTVTATDVNNPSVTYTDTSIIPAPHLSWVQVPSTVTFNSNRPCVRSPFGAFATPASEDRGTVQTRIANGIPLYRCYTSR